MKYLLSVALGPVQDFIAAARKTRDLYAGSWILSEISKAAGLKLIDKQADLIFPAAGPEELVPGSEFRAVNRLLAIVETEDPSKLVDEVRVSAKARLLSLGEIGEIHSVRYDKSLMMKHLERSLEFYAAWVPFEGTERYKENREQVEQLLASRKLLNAFSQHEGKGGRNKSSLGSGIETVIEPKQHRGQRPSDLIALREGEELDGAGMLKRFVKVPNREARFESTIEVAGMPYEKKIARLANENEKIKLAFTRIKNFAETAGLAGDKAELLYEHESREIFHSEEDRAKLKALRDDLYRLCGRPDAPYFALLAADGDSMGERISALGLEEHKDLSRRMSAFANQVRGRLIELECMPVFAGGDDVRAAIPLHHLLNAVETVRAAFRETVGTQFTLSAGIAIVHALDPLDEGMRAAKAAEREAKEVPGKNAICFTVIPRTGAPVTATSQWDRMMPLVGEIDRAFRSSRLSFGFAHELRELLGRAHSDLDGVLPDLARAIAEKKKKENSAAAALVKSACDGRGQEIREGLEHLVNCMLVTRKLSRASSEAFGDLDVQSDEGHRSNEQ